MADTLADIMHSKLAAKYPIIGPAGSISDLLAQFVVDNPTYIRPLGSLPFYTAGPTESLSDAAYRWWSAYAGGASAPFDLTNLAAWWDAADDAAFVFSSGNNVTQWKDKSANGLHVTLSAGAQAVRLANVSNGHPAIACTPSVLSRSNINLTTFVDIGDQRSCMWFSVVIFDAPLPSAWLGGGTSSGSVEFNLTTGGTQWSIFNSGVPGVGVGSTYFVAPTTVLGNIYQWTYARQGDADIVRRDGVDVPSDTNSATAGAMPSILVTLNLGASKDVGGGYQGKLAEIICISRYNQVQRDGIESYLKTKWGTP